MASKTPHTIWLKGDPQGREGIAKSVITPGDLLEVVPNTGPTADPIGRIHGVQRAGADSAVSAVAREGDIFGRGIDDDYAVEDTVLFHIFRKGDMFYGRLAAGVTVDPGDLLASVGGGLLGAVAEGGTGSFVAMEAVEDSTAGDRIKVEVV